MTNNYNLEIINKVINLLHETQAASKGSLGKLMGDKAELVICKMAGAELAQSNQPGFDLIGKAFLKELPQNCDLKYEIKLRRNSVTACNFEKSKIGKFDVGIIIWYNEKDLTPTLAYALSHSIIEQFCKINRAHITPKLCREYGVNFIELL